MGFRWLNLGFQPIFILIANQSSNTSEYLIQEMEKLAPTYIVYANMTSRISQISRLFLFLHSEIRETDYIITTDSDLLPLKKREYEIEEYTMKATTSSPKKGVYSYLALSNLIMSKKTWKEVMFFHDCHNSSDVYPKFDPNTMHAYQQVHGECPDKKIFNKARFRPEYFNEYFESHFGISEESSKNKSNWFEDQQMMSYRVAQWVMRGKDRENYVYYGRGKSPLTRLNNMDSQIREETLDIHLADRPSKQSRVSLGLSISGPLSVVGVGVGSISSVSIGVSTIAPVDTGVREAISIGSVEQSRVSLGIGLGLSISGPLAVVAIGVGSISSVSVGVSTIAPVDTGVGEAISIGSVEQSRVSLGIGSGLRLSISGPLSVVGSSIGIGVGSIGSVATIDTGVGEAISIGSVEHSGVSLGTGFRLSKGHSGKSENCEELHVVRLSWKDCPMFSVLFPLL